MEKRFNFSFDFTKQEDYAAFVREAWKESKLEQHEIAKRLGISQPAVSQALKKKSFSNTMVNGTRARLLDLFGFTTMHVFRVEKK